MDSPASHLLRWPACLAFVAIWMCFDALAIAPDFGQFDIYYFKDSAINFAQGLGLRTRFTYGSPTFAYHDYAQYPPLYPLTFGLFAKLAGVSARSNQLFNSAVAALVGWAGFCALRPLVARSVRGRMTGWLEAAIGAASIVTGYCYLSYDRPDGLAVALGVGALILGVCHTTTRSAVGAGVLCTLALFTSPFAGIWTSLAVCAALLAAPNQPNRAPLRRLPWVVTGAAGSTLALLVLLRIALPGWFDGFFGVATGSNTHNETGGGYFLALLKGDYATWWSGFTYSRPEYLVLLLKLGAIALALLWSMIVNARTPGRQRLRLWPLMIISPLCFLVAPYQTNYTTITAALLLAACGCIEAARAPEATRRGVALAYLLAFGVNVALTLPFETRALLMRSSAAESLSRALDYLEAHRTELEPADGYAAVSPTNYILWRQAGLHPLINVYSGFQIPANRAQLDILALAYPGSGDLFRPQQAASIPTDEYAPLFVPKLPQAAQFDGRALSRSSQTWESAIYVRRAAQPLSGRVERAHPQENTATGFSP